METREEVSIELAIGLRKIGHSVGAPIIEKVLKERGILDNARTQEPIIIKETQKPKGLLSNFTIYYYPLIVQSYKIKGGFIIEEEAKNPTKPNRLRRKKDESRVQKAQKLEEQLSKATATEQKVALRNQISKLKEKKYLDAHINLNKSTEDLEKIHITFSNLPETPKAYLGFIKKFGLIGVNQIYNRNFTKKESIDDIRNFHREFKQWYEELKNVRPGRLVSSSTPLAVWFINRYLNTLLLNESISIDLSPKLINKEIHWTSSLQNKTLAGALIFRLYEFYLSELKKCHNPSCDNPAENKYCSDQCGTYFRVNKKRGLFDEDGNTLKRPRQYNRR